MSRPATSSDPLSPASTDRTSPPNRITTPTRWHWYLFADLVLVTIFAALGRNAHEQSPWGALETAWPFLVGTLFGWVAIRAQRRPGALFPTGVVIWLSTEITGMLLRMLTGQGTALAFVLVSLGVLGLFLLGYRLIVRLISRARRTR
ncbi:DUF3054 domain-containing protein [Kocuria sp. cx-455]|uniref:DUF3054 domain-containing protein n=1 Tax=Kocuria sp. cx-455 TaxID=2771377 RepID=UPI003D751DEB